MIFNVGDMVTSKEGTIQTVPGFYGKVLSVKEVTGSWLYKVKVFSFISRINEFNNKRMINYTDSDIFFEFEMRLMTEKEINEHHKLMCFQ